MWRGTFVALVTPFLDDGSLDLPASDRLIERQLASGIEGIVLLGSTGEAALLEEKEKEALLKRTAALVGKSIPLIIGISSPSTQSSYSFGKRALALGASALIATPPYYVRPDWRGIKAHFETLSCLGAPLIVYHHPGRTGIHLSKEQLLELAQLPNVVAIKESGGGPATCGSTPVFCGDDPLAFEMIAKGALGSISVIANAYPEKWRAFIDGCLKGQPTSDGLEDMLRVLGCGPNPVPIKYLMSLLGLCSPFVRKPLMSLTEDQKNSIEMVVNALQQ